MTGWKRNIRVKQYRIKITDLAAEDLENAGDYIAYQLKNPLAAVNTVERRWVKLLYEIKICYIKLLDKLNPQCYTHKQFKTKRL